MPNNISLNEGLYKKDFLNNQTVGRLVDTTSVLTKMPIDLVFGFFDALKQSGKLSIERIEQIDGVLDTIGATRDITSNILNIPIETISSGVIENMNTIDDIWTKEDVQIASDSQKIESEKTSDRFRSKLARLDIRIKDLNIH